MQLIRCLLNPLNLEQPDEWPLPHPSGPTVPYLQLAGDSAA
jgi:hypothetical protein